MEKAVEQKEALQKLKVSIREKTPGNFYVFYGDETFLLHHYFSELRKLLIDPLTESFNFHKLTADNFSIQSFLDSVENLPMMAQHTMVWVDEIDIFKLPESDREKLCQVFADIPEYCTVVFTYETTQWKPDKRLKKLWDAVSKNGELVEFKKQSERDLIAWITRHFAANKKRIAPELCSYLISITDGTMTSLSGEIGKICAFSDSEVIVKNDIDTVVEPVLDAVVFQMTDCLSQGDYGAALRKLRDLLKMQQEPIAILGAVSNQIRRLGTARILLDNGRPASELMRICGMGEYPARKTMAAAGKISTRFCRVSAELALETDYRMKMSYDDQERLLEMLVLRMAQETKQ